MRIYTYYDNITNDVNPLPHDEQQQLIEVWKKNWTDKGFQPIVLDSKQAKKHPFFEKFDKQMREIYHEIVGDSISEYGMSCYHRWLAYASQQQERCYVSDYDVINLSFVGVEPDDGIHFLDNMCPSFVSGSPKDFEKLCHAMIEVSRERLQILKKLTTHYHDQELFYYNFFPSTNSQYNILRQKYNIQFTTAHDIGCFWNPKNNMFYKPDDRKGQIINTDQNVRVAHVAHYSCGLIKHRYPKTPDSHQLRLNIMRHLCDMNITRHLTRCRYKYHGKRLACVGNCQTEALAWLIKYLLPGLETRWISYNREDYEGMDFKKTWSSSNRSMFKKPFISDVRCSTDSVEYIKSCDYVIYMKLSTGASPEFHTNALENLFKPTCQSVSITNFYIDPYHLETSTAGMRDRDVHKNNEIRLDTILKYINLRDLIPIDFDKPNHPPIQYFLTLLKLICNKFDWQYFDRETRNMFTHTKFPFG